MSRPSSVSATTFDNLEAFTHEKPELIGNELTPLMIKAICDNLSKKPGFYLEETVVFLWDEFQAMVTTSSIRRALIAKGWYKKTARKRA